MKFTTSAVFPKSHRTVGVELEDSDMYQSIPEEEWRQMSLLDRFRGMAKRADILVIDYMRSEEEISPEFAQQRIREIQERYK